MISYLAFHHSGGRQNDPYASSKNLTLEEIDAAHRLRWPDFISQLGWYIGYNGVILPNGELIQTRLIGQPTAAVRGFNDVAASFCIIGNFIFRNGMPVNYPSPEQIKTVKRIEEAFITKNFTPLSLKVAPRTEVNVPFKNIVPHRALQLTECYGNVLDNSWARNLYLESIRERISLIQKTLLMLYDAGRGVKIGYQNYSMKLGAKVEPCWLEDQRDV